MRLRWASLVAILGLFAAEAEAAPPEVPKADAILAADAAVERARACGADATCDEALERAAATYEAAGMMGKAIAVRRTMLANAGNDAHRTAGPLYHLGTDYAAIAEYEQAAAMLERFAIENPTAPQAADALSDALVLRIGVGDPRRVTDDADRFRKLYGATKPDAMARIEYALAAWASERGEWPAVERALGGAMSTIDRGPTYLRMMAHALLGRAFARRGDPRAATEYAAVRTLGAALKPPPDPNELRSYAKGLNALGEAVLFAAEAKRLATTFVHLAPYAGGATDKEIDAWITTKVAPWVVARKAVIDALEPEYRAVLAVGDYPPPGAVVDASARVAMLWANAADEILGAPHPKAWDARGDASPGRPWSAVRKSFHDKLEAAGTALTTKAKPAITACVAYSAKFQFTDDLAAGCAAWLTKTYRRESPPLDELLVEPSYRASVITTPGAPLPRP